MDARRFDTLTRSLSSSGSRRTALRFVSASALGSVLALLRMPVARATHTPGDCLHNDVPCTTGSECCSGRCKRKVCRQAKNQGICTVEANICGGGFVGCGNSPEAGCSCLVTKKGHSFCGFFSENPFRTCGCASNNECERRLGKGAKCVQAGGDCACPPETSTLCAKRCPDLVSPP